jgi:hypothetical protein
VGSSTSHNPTGLHGLLRGISAVDVFMSAGCYPLLIRDRIAIGFTSTTAGLGTRQPSISRRVREAQALSQTGRLRCKVAGVGGVMNCATTGLHNALHNEDPPPVRNTPEANNTPNKTPSDASPSADRFQKVPSYIAATTGPRFS